VAILIQSSGTRNRPQRYALSLDRVARQALLTSVLFSAHDLFSCSHAIYDACLPSSAGARHLLSFAKIGVLADRWFAPRVPVGSWPEAKYHYLVTSLIVVATRWFGPTMVSIPMYLGTDSEARTRVRYEWKITHQRLIGIVNGVTTTLNPSRHSNLK